MDELLIIEVCPQIVLLEGLREITKIRNQEIMCPVRDWNRAPPECKLPLCNQLCPKVKWTYLQHRYLYVNK
jgi:hypothetical protein